MRAALAALLLLTATGCDSSDDGLRLDADFYVGTWTLTRVSDDSGDQTGVVLTFVDELAVDFASSGAFRLDADLAEVVNQLGQPDIEIEGTYQAQPDLPALVLLVDELAPTFQASAASENEVSLTAPAVVVEQLLGPLQLEFDGDVTLTVVRR